MKLESANPGLASDIKYSIIIPHKNSSRDLFRLLDTIPNSLDFQVIVVDDNSGDVEQGFLRAHQFNENVNLIFNPKAGGAGRARNIGLERAEGKWLLFADADDFFCDNLLNLLDKHFNDVEDIIYFGAASVFNNTSDVAYRHTRYLKLVTDFIENEGGAEDALRYYFTPPWGKMIKRSLVTEKQIKFEEILASNDMHFSINTAYHAKKIAAYPDTLYTITVSQGSLTNSFNHQLFDTKFHAVLRTNDFLRSIKKGDYQQSVLYFLARSHSFGFKYMLHVFKNLLVHRSNIFIGMEKITQYKTILRRRENPLAKQGNKSNSAK